MKINAIDIKPGNVLEHQNKLWLVLKRDLVQPGKGGSFAQVEMRDLRGGSKLSERFRTQETVERVRLDEKEMQFLYMEGDMATFMDNENFEQVTVPREVIGDPADFLADGMICQVTLYEGIALSVRTAAERDPRGGRGRSGGARPDRVVVLQARQARKRPPGDDPAAYRRRHPHRHQYRRRHLYRARQGLRAEFVGHRIPPSPGLDPGVHVLMARTGEEDVDGRVKPGQEVSKRRVV